MRILGRLLLLAVGGFLLYLSISSIIRDWSTVQAIGWDNLFSADTWGTISQIIVHVFNALSGLYCVYLALKGSSSFFSFIIAAILITIVVFRSINFFNSTAEKDWQSIFNLVLTYLMPIGYSLGVILLTVGGKKNS